MLEVILGNVFSLIANGSDAFSATRKTGKGVLWTQIVSQFFYGSSAFVLGGYSAVVQNAVSVLRNFCALSPKTPQWIYWVLVASGVGFGIAFNNLGLIGWLPILANLMYSLAVFLAKGDVIILKGAFLILTLMFAVFNFAILNFVGGVGNIFIVITTAVFIKKEWRRRKAEG